MDDKRDRVLERLRTALAETQAELRQTRERLHTLERLVWQAAAVACHPERVQ